MVSHALHALSLCKSWIHRGVTRARHYTVAHSNHADTRFRPTERLSTWTEYTAGNRLRHCDKEYLAYAEKVAENQRNVQYRLYCTKPKTEKLSEKKASVSCRSWTRVTCRKQRWTFSVIDKLATVVSRTKLRALATIDRREKNPEKLAEFRLRDKFPERSAPIFGNTRMRFLHNLR